MLNTYVVYVENKPGVLTRVASLFRRRAFNIDSLTVGRTEKPEVSRMTITVGPTTIRRAASRPISISL
jgi:acetolactate synthase-1/3 small subunit